MAASVIWLSVFEFFWLFLSSAPRFQRQNELGESSEHPCLGCYHFHPNRGQLSAQDAPGPCSVQVLHSPHHLLFPTKFYSEYLLPLNFLKVLKHLLF